MITEYELRTTYCCTHVFECCKQWVRASPPDALLFMSKDIFFRFRNQFRIFLWYPFRTGWGNRCDKMYDIHPDVVKTTVSKVLVLPHHAKSLTYHISYIVYFTLRVLCCCIPGCRPTVSHMDIVMNVDATYHTWRRWRRQYTFVVVRSCRAASTRICRLTSTSSLGGCVHAFLLEYHAELSRQRCFETFLVKSDKTVKHEAFILWLLSS